MKFLDEYDIEDLLVKITKKIVDLELADNYGGLLGGEFGYGVHFENELFKMHPFCWCGEDCKDCRTPEFMLKKGKFAVRWYKYIGRGMQMRGKLTRSQAKELLNSIKK